MIRPLLAALALSAVCVTPSSAQVITFETDPTGAASSDDAALGLASAYTVAGLSITFGIDGDLNGIPESTAFFERTGPDVLDGFLACNGRDAAATGYGPQLGGYFLRSTPGADFGVLIIDYSGGAVSAASGEIWDIDGVAQGTEQYRVRAFDSGGVLLSTIDSPSAPRRAAARTRSSTGSRGPSTSSALRASPASRSTSSAARPAASAWRSTISTRRVRNRCRWRLGRGVASRPSTARPARRETTDEPIHIAQ